jgi:DNA phosphorothioation-dependent restriction protein DptG
VIESVVEQLRGSCVLRCFYVPLLFDEIFLYSAVTRNLPIIAGLITIHSVLKSFHFSSLEYAQIFKYILSTYAAESTLYIKQAYRPIMAQIFGKDQQ